MSKHTPGPWEPLTFANHELQTDFAMVRLGGRVHMVGYSAEDKANALLIAAAPELLEALQAFPGFTDDATAGDAWLEKMRAAIAKATGEQSCKSPT